MATAMCEVACSARQGCFSTWLSHYLYSAWLSNAAPLARQGCAVECCAVSQAGLHCGRQCPQPGKAASAVTASAATSAQVGLLSQRHLCKYLHDGD